MPCRSPLDSVPVVDETRTAPSGPVTLAAGPSLGARRTLWLLGSLVGFSAALTILFLGMRAVMDVGGTCAEGTPFEIRVRCPQGVAPMVVGSIWGGLILAAIHTGFLPKGTPTLMGLAWPALFLSLGWNFLDYGLDPPGRDGLGWGSLFCAALFAVLGGGPLLLGISRRRKKPAMSAPSPPVPSSPASGPGRSADALVSQLERLDALRTSGSMSDTEFEIAKRRVLDDGGNR